MRVSYFSIARLPSRTANSIHVMKMCQALAAQGHQVTIYVPAYPNVEYEDISVDLFSYYGVNKTFEIVRFPWLPIKGRSTIYSLMASLHARLTGTQLVYARDLKPSYMCAKMGLPVVYEAHSPIKKGETVFDKMILSKSFKRLVVISAALQRIFEETYPQLSDKILVAHDAADIDEVKHASPVEVTDRLRIGYVGHLYRGRGVDLILDLAKRCPWADFEVVGGMDDDLRYWKSRAEEIKNIHFHGHLPYNQAGEIRQGCQILLAPYAKKLEVFGGGGDTSAWMSPLKIFEYMAAGKAIVSSDLPVLREVLENEKTALFCEVENTDEWQHALERLRDDPALLKRIGQQARDKLQKNHTWHTRAMTVIDDVIE